MKVHFIGIGGIGVSAIARMMLGEGNPPVGGVSGSDASPSPITAELTKLGAKIFVGQKAENISADCDLVIHTIAIPETNPELRRARELGIKTQTYPEFLGQLSREKFTIAVAGTHGKTTTTAMIVRGPSDDPSAAATATAVVSEPPRPRVVYAPHSSTP